MKKIHASVVYLCARGHELEAGLKLCEYIRGSYQSSIRRTRGSKVVQLGHNVRKPSKFSLPRITAVEFDLGYTTDRVHGS